MSTKEKKLAIALAGGLIISNLGVVTASANTNVLKEALVEQNKQNNFPTITQQTIKFDNNNSKEYKAKVNVDSSVKPVGQS